MATYISKATGNFTAAGTWAPISSVSNAELDSEAGTSSVPQTTPTYSATFTPAATNIDGVAIKIATRPGSTGTITVILENNTSPGTREGSLSINVSDIDSSGLGWYFFKFGSAVSPNGTDVYKVGISTSSATQVTCYRDSTANNWCRMLRLTSAASAPTTSDKLMVMGEWTAAATLTSYTVTMDETATTSYGPTVSGGPPQGFTINKGGTLAWATAASTNYYLKVKGIFAVYGSGTHQMYTSGTPCPSTSSAVLELDSAANVDSGYRLYPGHSATHYGNSKWPTVAITGASNATPIEITSTSHGLVAGERVTITLVGGNTAANGTWEVIASTGANTFTIGYINGAIGGGVGTSTGNGTYTSGGAWSRLPYTRLNTDEAAASTVHGVISSSGFATSDELCYASTTQTASQCEKKTISTIDSATQITMTAGLTNAHSGTSPTQAEVGNLTRNVKIRGISASLQGYVLIETTGTSAFKDVEFTRLGSATANKRGIDCTTTTGSCSITYCSIHDSTVANSMGVYVVGASSNNIIVSNNIFYNIASSHIYIAAATSGTYTIDGNLFVRNTDIATLLVLFDLGGTFTNNVIAGGASTSLVLSESNPATGLFYGNTIHSGAFAAINILLGTRDLNLTNWSLWRNLNSGIYAYVLRGTFNRIELFGNGNQNIELPGAGCLFVGCVSSGDTAFPTSVGVVNTTSGAYSADNVFESCTFGVVTGIKTAHSTSDFRHLAAPVLYTLRNTTLASSTEVSTFGALLAGSYISAQRLDDTDGNHKTWSTYGNVTPDTTIFNTASPSIRLTPNNASNKLATDVGRVDGEGAFFVPVANGNTVTVCVKVRESVSGDGTDYNGNRIRLILRKNVTAGITADTVLATATSASEGAWETIQGTTAAVTDDAVLAFVVDCDGTTGWVNVDDWSSTGYEETKGTKFWADGEPFMTQSSMAVSAVNVNMTCGPWKAVPY